MDGFVTSSMIAITGFIFIIHVFVLALDFCGLTLNLATIIYFQPSLTLTSLKNLRDIRKLNFLTFDSSAGSHLALQ